MSKIISNSTRDILRLFSLTAAVVALAGCASVVPERLEPEAIGALVEQDRARLAAGVEPVSGVLTLEEAIARALKYNADKRLKALDEAVASGTLEAGRYDMLPRLIASAGYRDRSSDLITRSQDSVTGAPSLANPSISSSRDAATAELGFTWSLLDFGQSYYAAKQNADRVLIAQERRRRNQHNLVQEVRTAYWRVVASQALRERLAAALSEARDGLKSARQIEDARLRGPLEPLRFQLQLLENIKLLETIQQELSTAKIDLAALINAPFAQELRVAEPQAADRRALLETPAEQLEETALRNNADFRESIYSARIAQTETRRVLLRLFPGLSFNYAFKYSDDEFLINNHWRETGLQISFNLLGLLSAPAQMQLAETGVSLAEQRRLVVQLAVLAQLHVARLQYANALRQYELADDIVEVEARIAQHVANERQAERQGRLEHVARQTSLILSQLRRYHALSGAHAAASRLQATLGMDLPIVDEPALPLAQLTVRVKDALQGWGQTAPAPSTAPAVR